MHLLPRILLAVVKSIVIIYCNLLRVLKSCLLFCSIWSKSFLSLLLQWLWINKWYIVVPLLLVYTYYCMNFASHLHTDTLLVYDGCSIYILHQSSRILCKSNGRMHPCGAILFGNRWKAVRRNIKHGFWYLLELVFKTVTSCPLRAGCIRHCFGLHETKKAYNAKIAEPWVGMELCLLLADMWHVIHNNCTRWVISLFGFVFCWDWIPCILTGLKE